MQTEIKKIGGHDHLVITLPMERTVSASGKSIVIATTRGNQPTGLNIDGKPLTIGVNAYIPNTK